MAKDNPFLMDADFPCHCGSIIGVRVQLAIIKATGLEVTCQNCQRRYLVTEEGAIPTEGYISGGVHHGHLAWDPNVTKEE